MALLCDVFGPGGQCDEGLFDGMSLDLGDLFADDLMGTLLNVSGPSTDLLSLLPCTATPDNLQPPAQAPCSSGDSHHAEPPCTRCSSTTNSGLSASGQLFQAPCDHPGSAGACAPVMRLPVQRSTGPPTRKAAKQELVRQVTTLQPVPDEQVARSIAPSPPAASCGNPPPYPAPACFQHDELLAALLRSGGEASEESDGSDTDEGTLAQDGTRKGSNKRKAPEIDWRSITDPAERRRQRRLAKNRMTAARSRERKKVQWADMEAKLARMDNDNKRLKTMLQQLAQENSSLRGQLEGMVQGKQTPGRLEGHSHSSEPAALVFITILLLLCCALPGDQAMLLGSAAPMLLLAQLLSQPSSSSCGRAPSPQPLATALLRFLATIKLLLSRASARLRASVHSMLFRRHHYVGRSVLSKTAVWAASTTSSLLRARPGLGTSATSFVGAPLIRIKQELDCDDSLSYIKQEPLEFPIFGSSSCLVSCFA